MSEHNVRGNSFARIQDKSVNSNTKEPDLHPLAEMTEVEAGGSALDAIVSGNEVKATGSRSITLPNTEAASDLDSIMKQRNDVVKEALNLMDENGQPLKPQFADQLNKLRKKADHLQETYEYQLEFHQSRGATLLSDGVKADNGISGVHANEVGEYLDSLPEDDELRQRYEAVKAANRRKRQRALTGR
ncbi:MAG: hypothetical protein AAGI27_03555 [Pseudomonadota bacterium]